MFRKLKNDRLRIFFLFAIEFLIMIAFVITTFFVKNEFLNKYGMHILVAVSVLCLIVDCFVLYRYLGKTEKFLNRTDITISSIFGRDVSPVFEFANVAILVYDEDDEVIWISQTTMLKKERLLGKKIYELITNFDDLIALENDSNIFVNLEGKIFQASINTGLKVVYLKDVSTNVIQEEKIESERLFVGNILIDNYQDVISSLRESDFAQYVTDTREVINAYANKYGLFIRQYSNDSFLIIGEEKIYLKMKEDKFNLLDDVRALGKKDDNPLTVSLGIGKGITSSILRTSELAYNALNVAMSRGGDQIVVNNFGSPLEYFGSKIEVKQTRSHVRGRVLASSLANIIKNASNVIIMGHAMSDFDAIGASLGVFAIAKAYNKQAYIVYREDSVDVQAKRAIKASFDNAEISKYCISPNKANQLVEAKTLVIVVDTHIPLQTLAPQLLDKCKNVCVVDHHRRSDVFINNPVFQYHEPQSSSASELVSELLYYQPTHIDIDVRIANFLLAGICLDTKFFRSGTSGKTFEMAMFLKNYQASVDTVSDFFKEEYEEMKLSNSIINNSYSPSTGIFIAFSDEDDIVERTTLAKVAEEILDTRGAKAVFIIGYTGNGYVSISARSTIDFNVEIIMESMGGGGHFSKAACQIKDGTIKETKEILEEKIAIYLRDGQL